MAKKIKIPIDTWQKLYLAVEDSEFADAKIEKLNKLTLDLAKLIQKKCAGKNIMLYFGPGIKRQPDGSYAGSDSNEGPMKFQSVKVRKEKFERINRFSGGDLKEPVVYNIVINGKYDALNDELYGIEVV
jgi:hypothetical protein